MKMIDSRADEAMDETIAIYGETLRSDVVKYPHHRVKRNAEALWRAAKRWHPLT